MKTVLFLILILMISLSVVNADRETIEISVPYSGSSDHWGFYQLKNVSPWPFTVDSRIEQWTMLKVSQSTSMIFGRALKTFRPLPNQGRFPGGVYRAHYELGPVPEEHSYIIPADDSSAPRWGKTSYSVIPGLWDSFHGYSQVGEGIGNRPFGSRGGPADTFANKACAMCSVLGALHHVTYGLIRAQLDQFEFHERMIKAKNFKGGIDIDWAGACGVFNSVLKEQGVPFRVAHRNNIALEEAMMRDLGIAQSVSNRGHWVNPTMWQQPGNRKRIFDPANRLQLLNQYSGVGTGWANVKVYYSFIDPKLKNWQTPLSSQAQVSIEAETVLDDSGIFYGSSAIVIFTEAHLKLSLFRDDEHLVTSEREALEGEEGVESLDFMEAPSGAYTLKISGQPGTYKVEFRSYDYDCEATVWEISVVIPEGASSVTVDFNHDAGTVVLNEPVAPELLKLGSEVFLAGGLVSAVVPDGIIVQGTAPHNRVPGVLVKGEFNEDALGAGVYYMVAQVHEENGQRYLLASDYQLSGYPSVKPLVVRPDNLPSTFQSFVQTYGRYTNGMIDGVALEKGLNAESWDYVPEGAFVKSEGVYYKGVFYARYPIVID